MSRVERDGVTYSTGWVGRVMCISISFGCMTYGTGGTGTSDICHVLAPISSKRRCLFSGQDEINEIARLYGIGVKIV
ncbi:MAG: hypothetical protein HPY71_11285 [Firmicutes bacterium]|nr:hypothetical protein [Bacillota bacterium]